MNVALLVSQECPACREAEAAWRHVAEECRFAFAVIDVAQPEGRALANRLGLEGVPALLVDGALAGTGVHTLSIARAWAAQAGSRAEGQAAAFAQSFSPDNRFFVLASMVYLMIAGLGLAINGTLLTDGPARPVALHLMTVGFMIFLIYGLGAHMLPRFTGNPIRQGVWPWLQMGFAHAGLMGYVGGFLFQVHRLAVAGGCLIWLSLFVFTVRVLPVLWRRRPPAGPACRGPRET
ncbi:MAG: thioredoxin family protein [Betaproteobacteria bacterium]|nr:thioredoxin family protein [Betaproteobacteria bacterium]